uniref:DUF3305 domain-containing protein n=1 Tax=uncultured Thiotrichaceae bacterium TaxID=298394 RepID=A0A6S6UDQ9_9GAMM|nr:MAG: Unknown protein [uncultured Thiotrichaceae bacterium]
MNTPFPVSVIMEKRPPANKWADAYWKAIGLIVGEQESSELKLLQEQGDVQQYLVPNLQIQLYKDQCESYYHNMKSPKPSCYIIANRPENAMPEPFLVSMSFDEAHAYLEGGDEEVYSVAIPPELYLWAEAYVIDNYFPEKKKKRKLNNWKKDGGNVRA